MQATATVIVLLLSLATLVQTDSYVEKHDNLCAGIDPRFYLLPHPTECAKYIRCNHGKALVEFCPSGLQFNPKARVCDWPGSAGCEEKTTAPKPAPTKPTTVAKPAVTKPSTTTKPTTTKPSTSAKPTKPSTPSKTTTTNPSTSAPTIAKPTPFPTSKPPSKVADGRNKTTRGESRPVDKPKTSQPVTPGKNKKSPSDNKPGEQSTARPGANKPKVSNPAAGGRNKTFRTDGKQPAKYIVRKASEAESKPNGKGKTPISGLQPPTPLGEGDPKTPNNDARWPKPSVPGRTPAKRISSGNVKTSSYKKPLKASEVA